MKGLQGTYFSISIDCLWIFNSKLRDKNRNSFRKSEQNGINLEYGYLEFIARHIKSNIRDLEGTIIEFWQVLTYE